MKQIIYTSDAPKPIGPYSQANMVNGFLFVSGQIPINPTNDSLVTDSIKSQSRQVMENLKAVLKKAEMDFSNVVKVSIFITNMDNFGQVNEVYSEYFKENPPARECVQVCKLPKNVDVEISLIAAK